MSGDLNLWHHFASRDLKPIQKVTGVDFPHFTARRITISSIIMDHVLLPVGMSGSALLQGCMEHHMPDPNETNEPCNDPSVRSFLIDHVRAHP